MTRGVYAKPSRGRCYRCGRIGPTRANGLCIGDCNDAYNAMQASAYWSAIAGGQCTECGQVTKGARCSNCRALRKRRPSRQAAYRRAHEVGR